MVNFKGILLTGFIIFLSGQSVFAQTPDPRANQLLLNPSDVGDGFVLQVSRDADLESWDRPNQAKRASFRHQVLRSGLPPASAENQTTVLVTVGVFDDQDLLETAWRCVHYTNSPNGVIERQGDFGDRSSGRYPEYLNFIKDQAVVSIVISSGQGYDLFPEEDRARLMDRVKDKLLANIDSLALAEIPRFEVDYVYDAQALRVDATFEPGNPIGYQFGVRNLSNGEYQELQGWREVSAGSFSASFAGLAPGNYELSVRAKDRIGRTQEFRQGIQVVDGRPTETLPATKDAIIDTFDPNGNEGANGILALDKLLGRSSRSLVGFDLSDVDTENLSKATLVLSIHKEERIFGCGPGESVAVQALTAPWVEGNGKTYKVLKLSERRRGSGSGATWQRDTDSNISNFVANGGSAWSGAASKVLPPTAPLVTARDDMNGTLQFDVTDDVINGAGHGWLVRKQHENRASRISFYSKEGAAAKGDPNLAPRLILEFSGPVADTADRRLLSAVSRYLGFGSAKLRPAESAAEEPGLREYLQQRPAAAYLGEQLLLAGLVGEQPMLDMGARVLYRSWLNGELRLS